MDELHADRLRDASLMQMNDRDLVGRSRASSMESRVRMLRILLGFGFLAFGVAVVGNWTSPKWIALTLALYSVPVLSQLSRRPMINAYALFSCCRRS
jgi:hypothetical protein